MNDEPTNWKRNGSTSPAPARRPPPAGPEDAVCAHRERYRDAAPGQHADRRGAQRAVNSSSGTQVARCWSRPLLPRATSTQMSAFESRAPDQTEAADEPRNQPNRPHGSSSENWPPCWLLALGSRAKRGPLCAGVGGQWLAWLRPRLTLQGGRRGLVLECRRPGGGWLARCSHTCSWTELCPQWSEQPPPCPHLEHKESKICLHAGLRPTSQRVDMPVSSLHLGVTQPPVRLGEKRQRGEPFPAERRRRREGG